VASDEGGVAGEPVHDEETNRGFAVSSRNPELVGVQTVSRSSKK